MSPDKKCVRSSLRIGIDVGGTNTDAVLLRLDKTGNNQGTVLSSTKSPTTSDISVGIRSVLTSVIEQSSVSPSNIEAVAIGTTHFVNALVEKNQRCLQRVAVIRLCGKFTRGTPPFAGFPRDLRSILEGPCFLVDGGLQIDASEISSVNEDEIVGACKKIKTQNIDVVIISGVFSPIDSVIKQEEHVQSIVRNELPQVKTVISKEVANIGLIERENAAILNGCLLNYAHRIVNEFQDAARTLKLQCPIMVTSNDGTLLTCAKAEKLPIKTFSSGPTNSMRGAAFCAALATKDKSRRSALVVDIGGTTTEIGILLPSGFPRQTGSHVFLCGVRLKAAMPQVTSIGLGGGSLVKKDSDRVIIGPDSVGYKLTSEALVFGGTALTTTDVFVSDQRATIGDSKKVAHIDSTMREATKARIKVMLEASLDTMKTSSEPIPVYLVGGGDFLAPGELDGISEVVRLPHSGVANAIGAAIAQISGTVDAVKDVSATSISAELPNVQQQAIDMAVESGADPRSVAIIDCECIPVAYTPGKCRYYVKAAGEWTGTVINEDPNTLESSTNLNGTLSKSTQNGISEKIHVVADPVWTPKDITDYKPDVRDSEWFLSEIDLEWIAEGCYVLGCGGGGSPTHTFLQLRELVRSGHTVRVVDVKSLSDSALVGWGGGLGSPEVASERMLGEEYNEALQELANFLKLDKWDAFCALEIGGSNGMINMVSGSTKYFNVPILDADFMGRAYPTAHQVTPNVFDESGTGKNIVPAAMASGDGSLLFMTKAKSDLHIDGALRAACTEMGTLTGAAKRPLTVAQCREIAVKNTVSMAWRIGRAIDVAKKTHNLARVGQIIVDTAGGAKAGRVLFAGKIVEVSRRIYKGHTVGEIVIGALATAEEEEDKTMETFSGTMTIPFKNENLFCEHKDLHGSTQVTAAVPDLICVIDSGSGSALGTPDYKYGLRVIVIGITAAPEWTSTERGIALGGPASFGYDDVKYAPLGQYVKPLSVIEEYSSSA